MLSKIKWSEFVSGSSQAFKSYDFSTQKWIRTGTNDEIPAHYWMHSNGTYFSPSYPYVEDQLGFMYYEKSSISPMEKFEVRLSNLDM